MPCDIIAVGASAGGVEALQALVSRLPADLAASVFVVLHTNPEGPGMLASVLGRSGPLPASQAVDGEAILPGHIYVAPPDWHLLIEPQRVRLWHGPRENRHRPCINTTFRSAAVAYGPRVAGAVLTGLLDDGTTGLWWIKEKGGVAIVQDPVEARFPDMPQSALDHLNVDYRVGISEMAGLLTRLALSDNARPEPPEKEKTSVQAEKAIAATCPDCRGPLTEVILANVREYRCVVGHAYTPKFLLEAHDEAQERALWAAAVSLDEAATLAQNVSPALTGAARLRIEEDAVLKLSQSAEVHDLISRLRRFRVRD